MNNSSATSNKNNRRGFLKYLLTGGILGFVSVVVYPLIAYLKPPKQREVEVSSVKVGKLSEIEKNSGKIIRFGNKPVILIRTQAGDLKAFAATCTHLDCTVQFKGDESILWCACHNGKYDLNGRNISGPPPKPLDSFRVVIQGEEVLISKNT